jgi:tetratricopeptide (TPR) repeat protein
MRKASFVLSAVLALGSWVVIAGGLLAPSVAEAEQKVSAKVGVPLKAAQEAIQKKKWDQALAKIKEADGTSPKTSFDQYKINELLWYTYLQQGRNADAARVLEGQLNSPEMAAGERTQRTKTLAQLYFRSGSYGKATQYANQYLKSSPGDRDMQLLVATAAYQQKDYKGAITAANRLMKSGAQPSQDLLQLVLRCNYELNDAAGTSATLDQLLKYYPSADTWDRVLEGFFEKTKHDHELMALYRLAEDVGALNKPREFTDMSQTLVIGGFAIEGQRIIEKGLAANMFSGEEQGRAQRTLEAAKRKADVERAALPKAAAALAAAKTGDEAVAVGRLYFSAGDYAKSADALRKALAKGGLADADSTQSLLGVALTRQGNKAEAIKAFDAIKDPKFAEIGKLWKMAAR